MRVAGNRRGMPVSHSIRPDRNERRISGPVARAARWYGTVTSSDRKTRHGRRAIAAATSSSTSMRDLKNSSRAIGGARPPAPLAMLLRNPLRANNAKVSSRISRTMPAWPDVSQVRIATHVGCGQQYVGRVRGQLTPRRKLPDTRRGPRRPPTPRPRFPMASRQGSSPRARGTLVRLSGERRERRFIVPRAGSIVDSRLRRSIAPAHSPCGRRQLANWVRSSARMRRAPARGRRHLLDLRSGVGC